MGPPLLQPQPQAQPQPQPSSKTGGFALAQQTSLPPRSVADLQQPCGNIPRRDHMRRASVPQGILQLRHIHIRPSSYSNPRVSPAWFQLWMWVIALGVFLIIGFCYLLLMQEHRHYKKIDVIEQVKRYPANEHWIAISTDAYHRLSHPIQEALHGECRREGIGLLQVRSMAHVTQLEVPHPQQLLTGGHDLLSCYARSHRIRQKLCDQVAVQQQLIHKRSLIT